jgi:predicted metal-binding membrane protein
MHHADTDPLSVQRYLVLWLLLTLATMAWGVLGWQAISADMVASPTMGMRAPPFLVFWVVMMVAMMFPTAAPMILTFHRIQATKRERGDTFIATFQTIEELRQALLEFRQTYDTTWLIERHGFLTPAQFRHKQLQTAAIAA